MTSLGLDFHDLTDVIKPPEPKEEESWLVPAVYSELS